MKRCLAWTYTILLLQSLDIYITLLAGLECEISPIAVAFLNMNLFPVLMLFKLGTAIWLGTLYTLLLFLKAPRFVIICYEVGLSLGIVSLVAVCIWNLYCFSTYL